MVANCDHLNHKTGKQGLPRSFKVSERNPFRLHLIELFHGFFILLVGDGRIWFHCAEGVVPGPLGDGVGTDLIGYYAYRQCHSTIFLRI